MHFFYICCPRPVQRLIDQFGQNFEIQLGNSVNWKIECFIFEIKKKLIFHQIQLEILTKFLFPIRPFSVKNMNPFYRFFTSMLRISNPLLTLKRRDQHIHNQQYIGKAALFMVKQFGLNAGTSYHNDDYY